MIKESAFLFLLIGGPITYEEQYIGKIPDCSHAKSIMQKVERNNKKVRGVLCLDSKSFEARKKFKFKPSPSEQKVVDDIKEILPRPMPKPMIPLKRKE